MLLWSFMSKTFHVINPSEGFIRLPRSLLESEQWNSLRFRQQKLFLYILTKVQYAPYVYKHNGKDIHLIPGELCISLRRLVDDFNRSTKFKDEKIDLPFLQRSVSTFSKVGLTDTRTDTGITIISVIYPGIYNSNIYFDDTPSDTLSIQNRYSHLKEESKKDKKEDHPSIPSKKSDSPKRDDGMIDEFSSEKGKIEIIDGIFLSQHEIDECVKVKGSLEKVREDMKTIQGNKKRKHTIKDWPSTLANWKIEDETKLRIRDHIQYTENLCREFTEFDHSRGWRCYMYNDQKKDQRGILFESQSPYQESLFVALIDSDLRKKCEDFIREKSIRE